MSRSILAYDLGTGGAKASLYAEDGARLGVAFAPYETFYPATGWHEQRPGDWWAAVVAALAPGVRGRRVSRPPPPRSRPPPGPSSDAPTSRA